MQAHLPIWIGAGATQERAGKLGLPKMVGIIGGRDVEETYLYRGHARLAQGDTAAAKADYRRALDLNPGFTAAQEALEKK